MREHKPLIGLALVLVLASVCIWQLVALDGPMGLLLPLFGVRTTYAPGYSRSALSKVQVGWTKDEVRDLLGDPVQEREWCWSYSSASPSIGAGTDGRRRDIEFVDGVVVNIAAGIWFD